MRLETNIDEDIERRFREKAMKRFGYKKGALQKGIEEAIRDWLQKE